MARRLLDAAHMTVQIFFNEQFDNVQDAVCASLGECGFKPSRTPIAPGVEMKATMSFWVGKKGNELLAMFLPFIFKLDTVSATITAYSDGTTGMMLREGSSLGGNVVTGLVGNAAFGLASAAANAHDQTRKQDALSEKLRGIEAKVREKLGPKIAYEGAVKDGVHQKMI